MIFFQFVVFLWMPTAVFFLSSYILDGVCVCVDKKKEELGESTKSEMAIR